MISTYRGGYDPAMNEQPKRFEPPARRLRRVTKADARWFDEAEGLLADMEGIEAVYEVRCLAAESRRQWFKEHGLQSVATRPRWPRHPR